MRENESDSEGGWQQPPEYVNPWAPRADGAAAGDSGSEANATPPPENGPQDTIAFGRPPSQGGRPGGDSYAQPGHGNQAGSGSESGYGNQAGYGSRPGYGPAGYGSQQIDGNRAGSGQGGYGQAGSGDEVWYGSQPGYGQAGWGGQGGYGQAGSGQGRYGQGGYGQGGYGGQPGDGQAGYGSPGGHGDGSGFGNAGWGLPGSLPPERRGRGGRFLIYIAVAALAASIGAGVTVALDDQSTPTATPSISSGDVPAPHNNASGSGTSGLNKALVEKKVKPGLVDIVATLRYDSETAEGTGMIVSRSGLVLTNNHVIDAATSVTASLVSDPARKFKVQILGYDSADDVALLQLVGASGMTPVSFGNSAQVSLGTPVLALGNAEGLGGATPAEGIINALDRSIQASDEGSNTTEDLTHMLQTNAAIKQGDSGGALANNAGQVIGMITAANTSTSSQVGTSGGTLGFAIPINSALVIARQIAGEKSSAKVYIGLPGFLGVEVAAQSTSSNPEQQAADEQQSGGGGRSGGGSLACQPNGQRISVPVDIAPVGKGALILGVLCDTTAQSQGLMPGDVITAVNGQAVTTPGSLTSVTSRYHPGAVVSVTWESVSGARHTSSMTLGSGPAK